MDIENNWDLFTEVGFFPSDDGSNVSNSPLSSPNPKFEFNLSDQTSSSLLDAPLQFENQITLSPELLWSEADNDLLTSVLTQEINSFPTEVDATDNKKPRKKRQRKGGESTSVCDLSAVTLTREQLLKYSTEDLDEFVRNIQEKRTLSKGEEKELKRQRRLIKNRESAAASRDRKKQYIDKLEAEINALKTTNQIIQNKLVTLQQENNQLRSQLQYFSGKSTTTKEETKLSIGDILTINNKGNDNSNHINMDNKYSNSNNSKLIGNSAAHKLRTAGVTLLIVLFSFGLLFNSHLKLKSNITNNYNAISTNNRLIREPIPEVLPHANLGNVIKQVKHSVYNKNLNTNSDINNYNNNNNNGRNILEIKENKKEEITVRSSEILQEFSELKRRDVSRSYNSNNNNNNNNNNIISPQLSDLFMNEFANESTTSNNDNNSGNGTVTTISERVNDWYYNQVNPKSNTAYLTCPNIQQIIPKNQPNFDGNEPFYLSLLIPSQNQTETQDVLLEVHCQVLNIQIKNISTDFQEIPVNNKIFVN